MTKKDSFDNKSGIRTIDKGDLWEVSVVTFPMNDQARIDAVKSIDDITDFKSAERYLRDSCGLSRSASVAFVSRVNGLKQSDSGVDKEAKQIEEALLARFLTIKA